MRIPARQTRTEVWSCHGAPADKQFNKSPISSPRRTRIIHTTHLDGLCRLAFHLMRYGGGLVHLGTQTQTVLLSKWDKTAEKRIKASPPAGATLQPGMLTVFALCLPCGGSAKPHLKALYVPRAARYVGRYVHKWPVVAGDQGRLQKNLKGVAKVKTSDVSQHHYYRIIYFCWRFAKLTFFFKSTMWLKTPQSRQVIPIYMHCANALKMPPCNCLTVCLTGNILYIMCYSQKLILVHTAPSSFGL